MKKNLSNYIARPFALLMILTICTLNFACPKRLPWQRDSGAVDSYDHFNGFISKKKHEITPLGINVWSMKEIDKNLLPLVEEGAKDVTRIARDSYAYKNALDVSKFRVHLFRPNKLCENPGFTVRGDGSVYDGTQWDKDARPGKVLLCIAGINIDENNMEVAVSAHEKITREATRFEFEHAVIYHNDKLYWQDTIYHVTKGHPLLEDKPKPGEVSFLSINFDNRRATKFDPGLPEGFQAESMELPVDFELTFDEDGGKRETRVIPKGRVVCFILTK